MGPTTEMLLSCGWYRFREGMVYAFGKADSGLAAIRLP